jgi:hypothetical protein
MGVPSPYLAHHYGPNCDGGPCYFGADKKAIKCVVAAPSAVLRPQSSLPAGELQQLAHLLRR